VPVSAMARIVFEPIALVIFMQIFSLTDPAIRLGLDAAVSASAKKEPQFKSLLATWALLPSL
jgi:hypothetical protein